MFATSTRRRIAAGTILLGALATTAIASQASAAAASDSSPLTVVAAAPTVSASHQAVPVTVAVTNSEDQLLCSAFTVSLTWWRADGRHHSVSRGVSNQMGTASTTLRIPGAAMRQGMVRYYATATQQCGLLAPTTRYEGRWPANGSAAVAVV